MFVQASCAHVHALLAEHGLHWFAPLWREGYVHDRVEIDRGFVRPIALPASSPLLTDPSLFRMSPIVYRVEKKIGDRLPIETWRATRLSIAGEHGQVALRVPMPGFEELQPIVRERSILERFSNPAIQRVLDVPQTADGMAIVVALLGPQLSRSKPDDRAIARVGRQIALALDDLHAIDVYHGNIRQESITLGPDGAILAGLQSARCELAPIEVHPRGIQRGLFDHMAPEQVRGERWGAPTDVWALAMVLSGLALRRSPLRAEADNELSRLQAIVAMAFDVPRTPLGEVLARALVRDPDRRPRAVDLARQLEALA
jgi:serine/threonine protein kinase